MSYDNEDVEVLSDISAQRERKNLRTILNRGKMDKFELDEFLSHDM